MGTIQELDSGLGRALFSQAQLRVLGLLFRNPNRQFTGSEIIRLAQSGSGAVQRELEKLSKAGIISVTASGNRKLYQANRSGPIFRELHGLVAKTVGLTEPLRRALRPIRSRISIAFVYGSVAKATDTTKSDIDLLIIGDNDLSYGDVYSLLERAEEKIGRPVSPNVFSAGDWQKKLSHGNPFAANIVKQPKLFLIGTEHDLERIGEPGKNRSA